MGAHWIQAYDFAFAPDPGRLYRVLTAKNVIRLYRLAGHRWVFERAVPPRVAAEWYAHRIPDRAARGYLALPLLSEV